MRHVKSLKTIVNPQIRLDRSQLLNLTLSKFLDLFFLRNYLSRTRSGQSRWPDHYYEQNTVPDRPFFPHRLDEAGCGISGGRKYLDDLVAYEFGVKNYGLAGRGVFPRPSVWLGVCSVYQPDRFVYLCPV